MTLGSIIPGTIPRETPLLNREKVLPIFTPPCSPSVQSIFTQPTGNFCETLSEALLIRSKMTPTALFSSTEPDIS